MTTGIVRGIETWPPAGELKLDVLQEDGDVSHLYSPNGPWEVDLVERNVEPNRHLLISLGFPSKAAAEEAGKVLAETFARVRELASQPAPDQETCPHAHVQSMRFSRGLTRTLVCQDCTATLGEEKAA